VTCETSYLNVVILRKPVTALSASALGRFVTRAKRAAGLRGSVNLLVTSSSELRRLNRRFRGKNRPTDVLSFPVSLGSAHGLAGDIAIAADIATWNSCNLGHSVAEEIKILALHGLLHLAGYDHERDGGAMAKKEHRLRRLLGLPTGLIERNENTAHPLPVAGAAGRVEAARRRKRSRARAARVSMTESEGRR
jgi:probable rRNA maturation factor